MDRDDVCHELSFGPLEDRSVSISAATGQTTKSVDMETSRQLADAVHWGREQRKVASISAYRGT